MDWGEVGPGARAGGACGGGRGEAEARLVLPAAVGVVPGRRGPGSGGGEAQARAAWPAWRSRRGPAEAGRGGWAAEAAGRGWSAEASRSRWPTEAARSAEASWCGWPAAPAGGTQAASAAWGTETASAAGGCGPEAAATPRCGTAASARGAEAAASSWRDCSAIGCAEAATSTRCGTAGGSGQCVGAAEATAPSGCFRCTETASTTRSECWPCVTAASKRCYLGCAEAAAATWCGRCHGGGQDGHCCSDSAATTFRGIGERRPRAATGRSRWYGEPGGAPHRGRGSCWHGLVRRARVATAAVGEATHIAPTTAAPYLWWACPAAQGNCCRGPGACRACRRYGHRRATGRRGAAGGAEEATGGAAATAVQEVAAG